MIKKSFPSTITSKGQVTIPKTIRDYLGLNEGSQLHFYIMEDGNVVVKKEANINYDLNSFSLLKLLVKKGVNVAIVGEVGSGKTTLLKELVEDLDNLVLFEEYREMLLDQIYPQKTIISFQRENLNKDQQDLFLNFDSKVILIDNYSPSSLANLLNEKVQKQVIMTHQTSSNRIEEVLTYISNDCSSYDIEIIVEMKKFKIRNIYSINRQGESKDMKINLLFPSSFENLPNYSSNPFRSSKKI